MAHRTLDTRKGVHGIQCESSPTLFMIEPKKRLGQKIKIIDFSSLQCTFLVSRGTIESQGLSI
jgi:hypothetical protein